MWSAALPRLYVVSGVTSLCRRLSTSVSVLYVFLVLDLLTRANDLDFMNDDQLVEIYRLNRHSIFEVCEEVEVMERKIRRSMALPVSLQVGASNVGPNHDSCQ